MAGVRDDDDSIISYLYYSYERRRVVEAESVFLCVWVLPSFSPCKSFFISRRYNVISNHEKIIYKRVLGL